MATRATLLKDRAEELRYIEELAKLDADAIGHAWFEHEYLGCRIIVRIRRKDQQTPWKIAASVLPPNNRSRELEVMIPAADASDFRRSSDAYARGLQLARRAIDDNLLGSPTR